MENIIGYRVVSNITGMFLTTDGQRHFFSREVPLPIPRGDAYRRFATFIDENENLDVDAYEVEPVYYEPKPIERGAKELGGLLTSLCERHGIVLNLSQEQIEKQIVQELTMFGASAE